VLADVQQFDFLQALGKAAVNGDAHLQCRGTATTERVIADATIDLTQAEVEYDWFFLKPRGMGGSLRDLHLDYAVGRSATLQGTLSAATSTVPFEARLNRAGGKWAPERIAATSESVNIATTSECLRMPYHFSGPTPASGSYQWEPSPTGIAGKGVISTALHFPSVSLLPDNGLSPLTCVNADFTSRFDTGSDPRTSQLRVVAEEAMVPGLASPWLPPFRPADEDLDTRFPRNPLITRYELQAERITMPPWQGTNFEGSGVFTPEESTIDRFAADIEGGGRLEGAYAVERAHNVGTLDARWTGIPAFYLLRHMKFPELLSGTMTGEVRYSVDRDDPSTLDGGGRLEIRDGQFSADFVVDQLASQLDADLSSLPPSLAFSRLSADIRFEGDRITTSNLLLESEGIQISGDGYFIVEGDMDYLIDVAVAPATAARIPVLAENLNVSGHRATQTDIKLAFHITGPTFSPSGRVAGLPPVGVTLVNGAFTVGGEVVKIIDTPRQILIDLFKIIGGAVGASRPPGGRR